MGHKLDTDREIVTMNGRPLRLMTRTTDGKLVLQASKSGKIVVVDEFGCIDGKEYAINRERFQRRALVGRSIPMLEAGQPVFCVRFSRRNACILKSIFVGYISKNGHLCKIVPAQPVGGRDVLKVPRHHIFESADSLREWFARLTGEMGSFT